MNYYIWLVYNNRRLANDLVSIWTTEELAKSALLFHKQVNPFGTYEIKKWQMNVTIDQWTE